MDNLEKIKTRTKSFWQDESGQTTTEYILILAVVITMIMQFKEKFTGIIQGLLGKVDQGTSGIADFDDF